MIALRGLLLGLEIFKFVNSFIRDGSEDGSEYDIKPLLSIIANA